MNIARNILAGVLIVSLIVILMLSDRDWVLSDQYRAVSHVGDVPASVTGPIADELPEIVRWGGVHVPRRYNKAELFYHFLVSVGRVPPANTSDAPGPPQLGYSVREWSFLGMPFGYYTEYGHVIYTETRHELVAAQLLPRATEQFHKELGRDPAQGFFFPFWEHVWGWLFVLGVAAWGWLQFRSMVRAREAAGII